jgi:hypothetical protein
MPDDIQDNHYWALKTRDGITINIPPKAVEVVKRRWDSGQPIHTSTQTIPANQIVSFEKTARTKTDIPLIEAAAAAFNQPIITEAGVASRWVKKDVSQGEFSQFYSKNPSYRKLSGDGGLVVVAFKLPVHLFDSSKLQYCSDIDIKQLTNN